MRLRYFGYFLALILLLAVGAGGSTLYVLYKYGRDLPDHKQLADYEPPLMTRVHAANGQLMYEYAREHRLFMPLAAIPKIVTNGFLSAEDKNFYAHPGIDILGVARAILTNMRNIGSSRRLVGASTITQQVAKNFLLSNEVTLDRKIKEAILAFRIERAIDKDRILELYLNQIYLGRGSYGVAAALNYFNKSLDELTLAESAYLAALPKAPNNYHPVYRNEAAIARRNWVLSRLENDGQITTQEAQNAKAAPLIVHDRDATEFINADYFTEEVRRQLYSMFGEEGLYEGGLSVRTSLDPNLQFIAKQKLQEGLITYDRRHGWRGPIAHIEVSDSWLESLTTVPRPLAIESWQLAIVLSLKAATVRIGVDDGLTGTIPLKQLLWARAWLKGEKLGRRIRHPKDVLSVGDVVAVAPVLADTNSGKADESVEPRTFSLKQIPEVEGAIIAMDPHTGRILAMVGGYSFKESEFNRASQARRQPGSAFKPFVYTAALDEGFTPSSLILDEPFVIDQGHGLGKWRPANYTKKFYGPSTLRLGVEKSRNLMTVRLAQYVGMDRIADYAQRFGVIENMPHILSMSLGAGETTLLKLTSGYATLVNGGKRITPTLIDRIQDRHGKNVYRHDTRPCEGCSATQWRGQMPPIIPDVRETVIEAATAYQMVSILQGVVERGTGVRIRAVGKALAGKTGTTNDSRDTWFIGFSPDLVVGVFVGFDNPRSLGEKETGSNVAAPIFRDFVAEALKYKPNVPFRIPPGIRLVRVNARTGLPARRGEKGVILEAFKPGTEPTGEQTVLDGSGEPGSIAASTRSGTGGLY